MPKLPKTAEQLYETVSSMETKEQKLLKEFIDKLLEQKKKEAEETISVINGGQ